ncbi:MAG: hypothetical protein Q8R55_04225 [Candidatus Taylorbacteria bacterium]|nr:hypothetical protein [Candidatus Taylorbacteria bacterium]
MSENTTAVLDPSNVFEDMVLSSAFEPRSASIEEKRQIFGKVWAESVSWLQNSFNQAGWDPKTESYGFGFLVEAFVRHSDRLLKRNTEKGEKAAREILSELQSGNRGQIRLGHSQSNSDFLWVELVGRRVTVTGIGEVKASYKAASQKIGGQLKRQERSLGFLAETLRATKSEGSTRGYFKKRGVVVSENLERFLIVPFGEGEKARQDGKFSGWQVVEIEFSYIELVFVAQRIWPDFRLDVNIGSGKLTNLFKIAGELAGWIKPKLDSIFADSEEFGRSNPLPHFELGLFFLATGKTPMLEDEVRWAAELVRSSFWPSVQKCLNVFVNSDPHPGIDFSERDKVILTKFRYVLTSNKGDLEHFIYFMRSLNAQIKDLARDKNQLEQLKSMSEVWNI